MSKRQGSRKKNNIAAKPPAPLVTPSNQGGFVGQMMGTLFQGAAFGTGSSIAHKTIDGITQSPIKEESTIISDTDSIPRVDACFNEWDTYKKCISENGQWDQANCNDLITQFDLCVSRRRHYSNSL